MEQFFLKYKKVFDNGDTSLTYRKPGKKGYNFRDKTFYILNI